MWGGYSGIRRGLGCLCHSGVGGSPLKEAESVTCTMYNVQCTMYMYHACMSLISESLMYYLLIVLNIKKNRLSTLS